MTKIADAYAALINALPLDVPHRENLEKRGFTAEQIEKLQYKSLPRRKAPIVDRLTAKIDPEGVPGFWKPEDGKWQLAGTDGLIVPSRDKNGEIISLKIRANADKFKGKYIQLSSNPKADKDGKQKFPCGTKAAISVHFPIVGKRGDVLRITEGELKADLSTLISGIYTDLNPWHIHLAMGFGSGRVPQSKENPACL